MREKVEKLLEQKKKDKRVLFKEYDNLEYTSPFTERSFSEELDYLDCEIKLLTRLLKD